MSSNEYRLRDSLELLAVHQPVPKIKSGSYCYRQVELRLVCHMNQQQIKIGSIELKLIPSKFILQNRFSSLSKVNQILRTAGIRKSDLDQAPIIAFVNNFYINAMLQGNGFGTKLINDFLDWLKQKPYSSTLLINTSAPVSTQQLAAGIKQDNAIENPQAKVNLQAWLNNFGFTNCDQGNNNLMRFAPEEFIQGEQKVA